MASPVPRERALLHSRLVDEAGVMRAYYQPPKSIRMEYPCAVYSLRDIDNRYADNRPYMSHKWFDVTYMTFDPDDPVIDNISRIPGFNFNRWFAVDGLNHYAFTYYSTEEVING